MRIISYKDLGKIKKTKKVRIYCFCGLFKKAMLTMSILWAMLFANLLVNNFFVNITASIQNFVKSFVGMILDI